MPLTQGWEEDVPRAWRGQRCAGVRQQVPSRLGRLPLGHIGQWRPSLGLRHPLEGWSSLITWVFDSLGVAAKNNRIETELGGVISATPSTLSSLPLPTPFFFFLPGLDKDKLVKAVQLRGPSGITGRTFFDLSEKLSPLNTLCKTGTKLLEVANF